MRLLNIEKKKKDEGRGTHLTCEQRQNVNNKEHNTTCGRCLPLLCHVMREEQIFLGERKEGVFDEWRIIQDLLI